MRPKPIEPINETRLFVDGELNLIEAVTRLEYWTGDLSGDEVRFNKRVIKLLLGLIRQHHAQGTIV